MSTQHTPGPYYLEVPPVCAHRLRYVMSDHDENKMPVVLAEVRDLDDIHGALANAKLFAAAPDLLAALEAMLKEHDILSETAAWKDYEKGYTRGERDRWPTTAKMARAAIKKAKGE